MPAAATRRRAAVAGAVGVLAVGLLVVAGAAALLTRSDPARFASVAFIGDSITYNAEPALVAGGAAADEVGVVATPGIMTREQFDAAADVAAGDPTVVVVNLGTNDAVCALENDFSAVPCRHAPFEMSDMRADLRTLAATFDGDVCLVGVEPTFAVEAGDEWRLMVAEGAADGVVVWGPQSRELGDEVLLDGIGHLTEAGNQLYAEVLWEAIGDICR